MNECEEINKKAKMYVRKCEPLSSRLLQGYMKVRIYSLMIAVCYTPMNVNKVWGK